MSNSNPQLKEYIREHLKNMYLEIQESSAATKAKNREIQTRLGVPQRPSSPGANAAFARTRNELGLAKETITQQAAATTQLAGNLAVRKGSERGARTALAQAAADNTALAGENATLTSAAAAKPMAKWTAGVKSVDSKLFGNAAQGEVAATKGSMGSGGKIGMGTKLVGGGIAAATQGLSSASTEWEENKNKGMGTGFENVAKTAVRGGVAGVGAGVSTLAGMKFGAMIGSGLGPVGTAIGAGVGALAAGYLGGKAADKAADMLTNIGDDDKGIKDFQGNRDIEDIERKARTQAAKQKAEDATRVKTAPAGVDYNSNDEDQVQNFTYNSSPNRGNGPGSAGGQLFVNMNQRQRNNPR